MFYERGSDIIPRSWIAAMKASMQSLCPVFSTDHMVQEYTNRSYLTAYQRWNQLVSDDLALALDLARWKERIFKLWPQVRIELAEAAATDAVAVGSNIALSARVALGDIPMDEVAVEGYFGVMDSTGNIQGGETVAQGRAGAERKNQCRNYF